MIYNSEMLGIGLESEINIIFGIFTIAHLHAMDFIISSDKEKDFNAITTLVIYEHEFYSRFTQELNKLESVSVATVSAYKQYFEKRMKNNMIYKEVSNNEQS